MSSCGDEPTAVVAHDDTVAIEQIDRLERAGCRVPRDVSVVGFDDIPLASHERIALTTVRTDAAALGARSVELLIAASRSGAPASTRESYPWQLVLRASTAAARRAVAHSGRRHGGGARSPCGYAENTCVNASMYACAFFDGPLSVIESGFSGWL